ncbi:MAG TPA: hypothetical protein VM243_02900 [Phycisphaerae bacterium]|nr:hypothetical protein [Phycisphaerae bacterium]
MTDQPPEALSPTGRDRREAMLDELVRTMERTHRNRRTRRRVLGTTAVVCLLLLLVRLALPEASTPGSEPQITRNDATVSDPIEPPPAPRRPAVVTVLVQTDPSVLDRFRAQPTHRVVRIDDSQLVATLASINRPAGLIRFGDSLRLSTAVTDADLGLKR